MMQMGNMMNIVGMCVAGCALAGAATLTPPATPERSNQPPGPPGIAVIELFTSQGCSSCPPADDLAARMAREPGRPVYVLAMHVDYWDYLGWKDPFAQSQFTKRQRAYANALGKAGGNGGVFTPEMVVNGTTGFTGSDEKQATQAIDRSIAVAPRLKVEASIAARKAGEPVKVRASIKGDTRWTMLCVAIVENALSVDVPKGENAGRTLKHDRVVRAFGQAVVKDDGAEVELPIPKEVNEANCRVVVFAQEEKTMRIAGAAEMPLEDVVSAPAVPPSTPSMPPATPRPIPPAK